MAKIYGKGLMWVPGLGRMLEFVNGVIVTDDPITIACAGINGFKVDGLEEKKPEPYPIQVKKPVPKVKVAVK